MSKKPTVSMPFAHRLTIEVHHGKKIIIADYTGLKVNEMIELHKMHADLVVETGLSFMADFHDTFVTTAFMDLARTLVMKYQHLEIKGAFLGINKIKSFILKGFSLFNNLNFRAFDSKEEGIKFLTDGHNG